MKEIYAVIRPSKDRETKEALARIGVFTFTSLRVSGRGKQRGLRYTADASGNSQNGGGEVRFLPKKLLYLVVPERQAKPVVQTIIRINETGHPGDGKIFVQDLEEIYRIRTGEKGEWAIR